MDPPPLKGSETNSKKLFNAALLVARQLTDDVRITRVGDAERGHAEVLTAGSAKIDVVCEGKIDQN